MAMLGVRPEVLESMRILEFDRAELAVAVLLVAAVFGAIDLCLQLTLRPLARRALSPKSGAKTPSDADVTKALVILVSFLHLAIQIPVGLGVLADPRLAADPVYGVSALSLAMVTISSGYFTYDLATVLVRYDSEGPAFLVHALCCLFVYGYAVFFGTLHWFGAAFLMWEMSTPFVHFRWLLSARGLSSSRLYLVNGLAMVAVFFCCRNLWGTYCSVRFFQATQAELDAPRPDGFSPAGVWGYRIANVSLNALNVLWFHKMATKAAKLLRGGGSGEKKQH